MDGRCLKYKVAVSLHMAGGVFLTEALLAVRQHTTQPDSITSHA
jgi:hypothetical protein